MLVFFFNAFLIAVIVWVYYSPLRDYLLSKWFFFGYTLLGQYNTGWKQLIYMPIWGCNKCTSGQLALWSYFFIYEIDTYSVFHHLGFIATTILINQIIHANIKQF